MTTLEELGLWYDEDTRCIIDTSSVSTSSDVSARVYQQNEDGVWMLYIGYAIQDSKRTEDNALSNYLEDVLPPAEPGEVWEIVLESGEKFRAVPYESCDGSIQFSSSKGVFLPEDIRFHRRLLITTEGEYVG